MTVMASRKATEVCVASRIEHNPVCPHLCILQGLEERTFMVGLKTLSLRTAFLAKLDQAGI